MQCKNICERELITNLYKQERFDELLNENDGIAQLRNSILETITKLKNCILLLNGIDGKMLV